MYVQTFRMKTNLTITNSTAMMNSLEIDNYNYRMAGKYICENSFDYEMHLTMAGSCQKSVLFCVTVQDCL